MKIIKLLITIFFLTGSYWISFLIFSKNFEHAGIKYSTGNWDENTFMILLISTALSALAIFLIGILSLFTNFVFIKLIYSDEIKNAAIFYIKNRNNNSKEITEYIDSYKKNELKNKPLLYTLYKIKKWII